MAFSLESLTQAALKRIFGLVHTEVKVFPFGNEANPSQLTVTSQDIYVETIPATAQAIANRIVACTNATDGQADSYLTVAQNLAVAPDGSGEGHPYLVTVPAGHGLIGQINPQTGIAYVQGDIVQSIIPKKFGLTWRPILYDSTKTEIPPLSSLDWILDERGFVVIRDNSTAPAYLGCWIYVGRTRGVTGISKVGESVLTGEVTLSQGANITLTQVGNDILITGAAAGSAVVQHRWMANGSYLVGTDVDGAFISDSGFTITGVWLYRGTAGSASSTIVDIHKNGTTLYTTQANRPTIAFNDADKKVDCTLPDVVAILAGDIITMDIDTKETGSPKDLMIIIQGA
jgi:hypothetical protein